MKYVFIGPNSQATQVLFRDLFELDNVIYVEYPINIKKSYFCQKIIKVLFRTEFIMHGLVSGGIVKFFCSKELLKVANENKESVFIYFYPWISTVVDSGIMHKIKNISNNIIHVAMFYDIQIMNRHNLDSIKRNYDIVATYDENEACKANVSYIAPIYSRTKRMMSTDLEQYDLSFVGKAKDRYDLLIAIYDFLEKNNVTCHFFILGVPKAKRKKRAGIEYGDREISSDEADLYIESSKCILDLVPYGTDALTSRHREAVIYGKKLLSNNRHILSDKYYNTGMMQYFSQVEKIDITFFNDKNTNYNYNGDYCATNFIKDLDALIKEKK